MRIAGVPEQFPAKERATEPTRVHHPRRIIVALFDGICNPEIAKGIEHGPFLEKLDSFGPTHTCGRAGGGLPSRQWATRSGCSVQNAHNAVAPRIGTFAEGSAPQSLSQTEHLIPEHGNHVGPGSYSKHNEHVKRWSISTPLGRNFV